MKNNFSHLDLRSRSSILFIVVATFFSLLLLRLVDLQVVSGQSYVRMADSNRYYSFEIPAERGVILDRYGDSLTYNTKSYYELLQSDKLYGQKRYVNREEALNLIAEEKVVGYDLARFYLYPKSLAHVLGYVGPVSAEDLEENKTLGFSDIVGKMGLEKKYDSRLQGSKGKETYEINALGKKQRLGTKIDSVGGNSLSTTLDPYLSDVAFRALGNSQGAVIILDAETGQILSMVDSPSFDANVFGKIMEDKVEEAERKRQLNEFISDQRKVFFNRAIGGSYPPGSVFKLVTALAGLESEKINKNTLVLDEGVLKVGEYQYANWYFTQHGRTDGNVDLVKALSRSNDIYFYKVAEWVGPDRIAEMSRQFGFGKVVGLELPGEARGLVPDPAWKEKTIGERWFLGNTYHYGIGQGDILVTPLQVSQMVQGVANKGRICTPFITFGEKEENNCSDMGLHDENIDLVIKGMLSACSPGGTGYTFFQHNAKFGLPESLSSSQLDIWQMIKNGAIACKTGTAEFGGADHRGYRNTHGWFVATLGVNPRAGDLDFDAEENEAEIEGESELLELRKKWLSKVEKSGFPKQIVIVALVESDELQPYKEGSRDAGPVVNKIVEWIEGDF